MVPVLIFEGHDRSGKTTIAEAVANYYNTEVFMTNSKECFTSPENFENISKFNLYISEFVKELAHNSPIGKPIIIYRNFLSEMVYSILFDRKTNIVANDLADTNFSSINATIVLCKNDRDEFNDESLGDSRVKGSIKLYDKLKTSIKTDILAINTKEQDVARYTREIISFIDNKYY